MNLVIGYGQIGQAVGAVIGEHGVIDLATNSTIDDSVHVNIMHICIPYSDDFQNIVQAYINIYNPTHVIIYSTVPIGTTKQFKRAVHSPVEGKHPDLEMSLRQMERWIGYNNEDEGKFFAGYFRELGLKTRLVLNSNFTEALKLLSTTEYGVNLVFADYKAEVADKIGMDYKLTKEWNEEYNRLYQNLGLGKRFQKFVLDAPGGKIGGHCVVSNAKILNDDYPDELLDLIEEME